MPDKYWLPVGYRCSICGEVQGEMSPKEAIVTLLLAIGFGLLIGGGCLYMITHPGDPTNLLIKHAPSGVTEHDSRSR